MDSKSTGWLGLEDKLFAVTGGGRGIGQGIVECLVDAGARVCVLDKSPDESRQPDERVFHYAADITSSESISAVADTIAAEIGCVNGLVNCAGVFSPGALTEMELSEWDRVINTNLRGALVCSRAFTPHLDQHGGGAIVHIASVAAHFPQTNSGAYSASKAGVLQLSKQLAVELSARNIRSNTVCPGMIRTPLSEPFYQDDTVRTARESMTASGRIGVPEDIAHAVAFLLSDRSQYVNATELIVDGGFESMLMHLVPRPGFNQKPAVSEAVA